MKEKEIIPGDWNKLKKASIKNYPGPTEDAKEETEIIHGEWKIFRGRPTMPKITLGLLKTPWRRKRLFLVDEILRGSSAISIMTLALLKTPWRRRDDS